MPFHRKKLGKDNQDSMWASYSDLFLGLSIVFLLLYVTASLKQGTDGIRQMQEHHELTKINQDLKQQIKVYNSLRQNYLDTTATDEEQETYKLLMSKLDLLKDEANNEKKELMASAKNVSEKEKALNQYQQMIRNVMNVNLLSKSRIKNRDELIDKKDVEIDTKNVELNTLNEEIEQKKQEIVDGQGRIASLEVSLDKKLKELKSTYKQKKMSEKNFLKKQNQLKNEYSQKIAVLEDSNKATQDQLGKLGASLSATKNQLSATQGELSQAGKSLSDLKGKYDSALDDVKDISGKYTEEQGKVATLSSELAKAKENLEAKKKLAEGIKKAFSDKGITADVDASSGDVLLSFGEEYFDTGKAQLKPGMRKVLEKAVPEYSKSLFKNKEIAGKIANIEIIGFASPTYKNKYIDPSTLRAEDRGAVNYNLDLSYQRARSIFDHMYGNMIFEHKKEMLPLIKVSGRSFLANKKDRSVSSAGAENFCLKNDCSKLQKVVIKFNLKD